MGCLYYEPSSRLQEEQSLVKWASVRLHDRACLEQMVDPRIKGTISSKNLSRYADIVSLCIQVLSLALKF